MFQRVPRESPKSTTRQGGRIDMDLSCQKIRRRCRCTRTLRHESESPYRSYRSRIRDRRIRPERRKTTIADSRYARRDNPGDRSADERTLARRNVYEQSSLAARARAANNANRERFSRRAGKKKKKEEETRRAFRFTRALRDRASCASVKAVAEELMSGTHGRARSYLYVG
jgi:hypothetical protein